MRRSYRDEYIYTLLSNYSLYTSSSYDSQLAGGADVTDTMLIERCIQ